MLYKLEDFISFLKDLDELLTKNNIKMNIKAIGGFALILYSKIYGIDNLRTQSQDIDSYENYNQIVLDLIHEVALKNNIEDDWLNTYWYETQKRQDLLKEYEWIYYEDKDISFKSIKLYFASIEDLLKMKFESCEGYLSENLEPRINDVIDIIKILKLIKKENTDKFKDLYPLTYNYIEKNGKNYD